MLISDDPLGDNVDMLDVVWTVTDPERCRKRCFRTSVSCRFHSRRANWPRTMNRRRG